MYGGLVLDGIRRFFYHPRVRRDRPEAIGEGDRWISALIPGSRMLGAGTDGPFHNVIKIRPPLCFSEADADLFVTTLDAVLSEDPARTGG